MRYVCDKSKSEQEDALCLALLRMLPGKNAHVYVSMNPWTHTVVMCTPPGHNLSILMGAVAVNMHTCRHNYILWWRGASSLMVMNLVAQVWIMWFARV